MWSWWKIYIFLKSDGESYKNCTNVMYSQENLNSYNMFLYRSENVAAFCLSGWWRITVFITAIWEFVDLVWSEPKQIYPRRSYSKIKNADGPVAQWPSFQGGKQPAGVGTPPRTASKPLNKAGGISALLQKKETKKSYSKMQHGLLGSNSDSVITLRKGYTT
jgi:hypothetical protein